MSKEDRQKIGRIQKEGPGGCTTQDACRTYCQDPAHGEICVAWAEKNGFISKDEAERSKKFFGKPGPCGCRGEACKTYCEDVVHYEECYAFAKDNGFITKENAAATEKTRKFIDAVKNVGGPGGCKSEAECKKYCNDPAYLEECAAFAVDNGFITKEESARIKKIAGTGPGGCRGEEECRAYCNDQANTESCRIWAVENGMMTKEEAVRIRQFTQTQGPGGCKGENECRAYCADKTHQEECIVWAEKNGFIKKDEAERTKTIIGKPGPGGCQGEACKTYCEDPTHREECYNFAKENKFIDAKEFERFEQSKALGETARTEGGPGGCRDEASCRAYCQDPQSAETCLNFAAKQGGLSREQAERKIEEIKKAREYDASRDESLHNSGEQNFQGGPGGCNSAQQCGEYCSNSERREECSAFIRKGEVRPQSTESFAPAKIEYGPGGCRGLKECLEYCQQKPEACGRRVPEQNNEQRVQEEQRLPEKRQGMMEPRAEQFDEKQRAEEKRRIEERNQEIRKLQEQRPSPEPILYRKPTDTFYPPPTTSSGERPNYIPPENAIIYKTPPTNVAPPPLDTTTKYVPSSEATFPAAQ